jgi:insulysin
LQQFAGQLLARIDVEMLVHGNYLEADARRLGELVQRQLLAGATPVPAPAVQIMQLPAAQDYRRTVPAPHDDAALLWYRQAADNAKSTRAALGVSAQMLGSDFYAQLRTEQQLGYIVTSMPYPQRDVPGLVFLAQSPAAGPAQLAAAYNQFIQQWAQRDPQQLRILFEQHRAALAQRLAEQPKNLGEATERLWQDLTEGYVNFDSREQIIAAVNALTFDQWLTLFRRDVLAPEGHALWLAVNGRFAQQALQRGEPIGNLEAFKAARTFTTFP